MSITGEGIALRLAGLDEVGRRGRGYTRLAWTLEHARAAEWFAGQAEELGRRHERDEAGNLWSCPWADAPWWALGSHLDTVRDGGRYDGALGVAAAFEIAAHSRVPLAVIAFADEEGARFNTPTFGSRASAGLLDAEALLTRYDDEGVSLHDALTAAGLEPKRLARASDRLDRLRGFLEIHIDQTTELADAGLPVSGVRELAARMRLAVRLDGAADHAGTTPTDVRCDALSAAAHMIVAAERLASAQPGVVVTTARMLVEPNAPSTVPSRVRMWVDARAPDPASVRRWEEDWRTTVEEIASTRRVRAEVIRASFNEGTRFHPDLRGRLAATARALGIPFAEVTCFAGHDAGIVALRRPAAMLLVRNPSGISHSPQEHVELSDAALAASIALRTLEDVA